MMCQDALQGKEGERDFWSNIMPEAIAAHDQQVGPNAYHLSLLFASYWLTACC